MQKNVPVWFLLLVLLLGLLFTMFFGWSVKTTVEGSSYRSGRFGEAAVAFSSLPTLAKSVVKELTVDVADPEIFHRVPRPDIDLSGYTEVVSNAGAGINGLLMKSLEGSDPPANGWRVLVGVFAFGNEVKNAALAISPEFEIEHIWLLDENSVKGIEAREPHRKFIHGFAILEDGSVLFAFDGGVSLQRIDKCGKPIWGIPGQFHHSVTLDGEHKFAWTLRDDGSIKDGFAKVDVISGEIVKEFAMSDIVAANPGVDLFELRKHDNNDLTRNSRNTKERWLDDEPYHLNDVDPLPANLADKFSQFETGDLLVSARSTNLVFVVDPDSLVVKWWRIGETRRQHDPDWESNGEISVLDNRMSRDYSRIVSIDPQSFESRVLFDGRDADFYTRIRGKHQSLENGHMVITSPQQGRAFEIDQQGNVALEFMNTKVGSKDANYVISEEVWLPPSSLEFLRDIECAD